MTTYPATNLKLTYDDVNDSWSYTEEAYEYTNPTPPTWSGYTSPDPDFEFAPTEPDTSDPINPDDDPCPEGYIYDSTLKQCVPDPNYAPQSFLGVSQNNNNNENTNLIPSNEEKEKMIASGDAASYIDNLKDRGFVKIGKDGKLYLKKDNLGSTLAKGLSAVVGKGFLADEVDAKTNKIIQDLQRMGAINTNNIVVTGYEEDGSPILDFASDLEISTTPGTFGIYAYEPGTAETNFMPGNFLGVKNTEGVVGQTTYNPDGTIVLGSTWENYIKAVMENSKVGQDVISSVTANVQGKTLEEIEMEEQQKLDALKKKKQAEKKQVEADIAKMDALETGQSVTDSSGDTYTKVTQDNPQSSPSSSGYSFQSGNPQPVTYQSYQSPGMSNPVYTGPRAGVMAPKSNTQQTPAVNYEDTYGADI